MTVAISAGQFPRSLLRTGVTSTQSLPYAVSGGLTRLATFGENSHRALSQKWKSNAASRVSTSGGIRLDGDFPCLL